MDSPFRLIGTDDAINDDGIRIYIPKMGAIRACYEAGPKRLTIRFTFQRICNNTITVYLFSLPGGLRWDDTATEVTEEQKTKVSKELTDAFRCFGALGIRDDEQQFFEPDGTPEKAGQL